MSENQYEPKLVTTANRKPISHAVGAAERFADEQQQRAHRAEQQRGLHGVVHMRFSVNG